MIKIKEIKVAVYEEKRAEYKTKFCLVLMVEKNLYLSQSRN